MHDDGWKEELKGSSQILQIIFAAMTLGCLTFTVIASVMVFSGLMPAAGTEPLLTYLGVGITVFALAGWTLVPEVVAAKGRKAIAEGSWDRFARRSVRTDVHQTGLLERTGDAGRLMGVYTTRAIVAMALLEGGCFANLVFFLIEQETLLLGLAVALLAMLAIGVPTHARATDWIERHLRNLEEQRKLGA